MFNIGIMQGRILPEDVNFLQFFPWSHWKEELPAAGELGFDYYELLFDKNLLLKKLLSLPGNYSLLGLNNVHRSGSSIPEVKSICMDYLCLLNLLDRKDRHLFCDMIKNLISHLIDTSIEIIVIPFFEKNLITSANDLRLAIEIIHDEGIVETALNSNLTLALELDLPANVIRGVLSEFNYENVRICYDMGNASFQGYKPEKEIADLNEFICHVHVKDRRSGGPNVMLGDGDVNFINCFRALKTNDYDGMLILETGYFISPEQEAKRNLDYVRHTIEEIIA